MSRSYRKFIRCFTCCGDNRGFYKARRRRIRNLGRMQLRSLMAHYTPDAVGDLWTEPDWPAEDQWAEPTDGHWAETFDTLKNQIRIYGDKGRYYARMKQFRYYLKPKKPRWYKEIRRSLN